MAEGNSASLGKYMQVVRQTLKTKKNMLDKAKEGIREKKRNCFGRNKGEIFVNPSTLLILLL